MFHANTQRLIDYWTSRCRGAAAPSRADIDPTEIPTLAPQLFLLGRAGPGRYRFRLAGGLIGDLHRADLRDADFFGLWRPDDRLGLAAAVESSRRETRAFVARAETRIGAAAAEIEIVLAPLAPQPGGVERCLGLYQPLGTGRLVNSEAAGLFRLRDIRSAAGEPNAPSLRLASVDGRRIA